MLQERLKRFSDTGGMSEPTISHSEMHSMAAEEIERLRAALAPFAECWEMWQGEKPPESRMLMFASEGGGTFLGYADVRHLRLAYEALHTNEQSACQECKDELPSLNWRNGKPFSYCPECGRESAPKKLSGRWVSPKEYHHDSACAITMGGECNCDPGEQTVSHDPACAHAMGGKCDCGADEKQFIGSR